MKIIPVASDSMGVRSMATLVVAGKTVFIDPSAALGPVRYGLPPSEQEIEMLGLSLDRIVEFSGRADPFFITHYHYDHHPHPDRRELYEKLFSGKTVVALDYRNLHASGRERGRSFEIAAREYARELVFTEGEEFKFGSLKVETKCAWHGEVGSRVGKVLMLFFRSGKKSYLFGSDAQNLSDPGAREWFEEKRPDIATIDGYPTTFIGWRFSKKRFEESKVMLAGTLERSGCRTVILEHHLLRDLRYREKIPELLRGFGVKTAAEYLGLENLFLEALRKKISDGEISPDVRAYDLSLRSLIRKALRV